MIAALPGVNKIGLHGGVGVFGQLVHGANGQHPTFTQHGNPVTDMPQHIQVMGHHNDGWDEQITRLQDQLANAGRTGGVQARRRFVQQQQLGVQRQGTCQRSALEHAAAQGVGVLVRCFCG